jgi:integrase
MHSLRSLYNRGADLYDCESVKSVVALKDWSNGMKRNVLNAYQNFAKFTNIPLTEIPEYKQKIKLPFIANESELDRLVACAGPKLQPFLQTLKETGARSGEVASLKWEDVDFERHIVTINNAEKGSNPRQLEMSEKLVTMLKRIPQETELVFGPNAAKRMRKLFHWTRTRLAFRTQNQRIRKSHLHSFRHWFGTMLYHHTKDIMLVKQKLGHRSITSTQLYVQLLQGHGKEEYLCKVATTLEEAQTLIESGFEYVTSVQIGQTVYKMFRKKKPWQPS